MARKTTPMSPYWLGQSANMSRVLKRRGVPCGPLVLYSGIGTHLPHWTPSAGADRQTLWQTFVLPSGANALARHTLPPPLTPPLADILSCFLNSRGIPCSPQSPRRLSQASNAPANLDESTRCPCPGQQISSPVGL